MRLIASLLLGLAALLFSAPAGHPAPSPDRVAALARGINITNWFRYPTRADDTALRTYLDDAAIQALRGAGFTFVRLAVQPELLDAAPGRLALLVQAAARLQRAGLAVVLGPHPIDWHLEQNPADRTRLLAFGVDRKVGPSTTVTSQYTVDHTIDGADLYATTGVRAEIPQLRVKSSSPTLS